MTIVQAEKAFEALRRFLEAQGIHGSTEWTWEEFRQECFDSWVYGRFAREFRVNRGDVRNAYPRREGETPLEPYIRLTAATAPVGHIHPFTKNINEAIAQAIAN